MVVLCFVVSLLLNFFLPSQVEAHMAGQPPFFKINDIFTHVYQFPQSNSSEMIIPQDIAPDPYLVGQPLVFEIDPTQLGAPEEVVTETRFIWDMGDGAKGSGFKNTHAYPKIGSYILTVYADYKDSSEPILLQSTLIHIVPDKNFLLPQAVLTVNGKRSTDPLNDVLRFNYVNPLQFDAGGSQGNIKSVLWDFGDGKYSKEVSLEHAYNAELGGTVFPILQVIFKNGFRSHAFVQIDKAGVESTPQNTSFLAQSPTKGMTARAIVMGIFILFLCLAVMFLLLRKRKN